MKAAKPLQAARRLNKKPPSLVSGTGARAASSRQRGAAGRKRTIIETVLENRRIKRDQTGFQNLSALAGTRTLTISFVYPLKSVASVSSVFHKPLSISLISLSLSFESVPFKIRLFET